MSTTQLLKPVLTISSDALLSLQCVHTGCFAKKVRREKPTGMRIDVLLYCTLFDFGWKVLVDTTMKDN